MKKNLHSRVKNVDNLFCAGKIASRQAMHDEQG